MRNLLATVLLVSAGATPSLAQTASPPSKSGVAEIVTQLEHDWLDAEQAGDADKVSHVLADDWRGVYGDGSTMTKAEFVSSVRSGGFKVESYKIAPIDVKVLGDVAVAQGGDTEQSRTSGKDSSGRWIWMDVFVNRGGKWAAVRSQTVLVK